MFDHTWFQLGGWRFGKVPTNHYIGSHSYTFVLLNKNWNYVFSLFLYRGHYQQVLYNLCLFLLLRHGIQETKKRILRKRGFVFYSKNNNFSLMKSNQFDFIHYTEIIFLSKNVIILYILKIFFTMLHLKMFLKFRRILYIFRISFCVTSS